MRGLREAHASPADGLIGAITKSISHLSAHRDNKHPSTDNGWKEMTSPPPHDINANELR